jgi:outer membrane receptor protein involved in Fe transport
MTRSRWRKLSGLAERRGIDVATWPLAAALLAGSTSVSAQSSEGVLESVVVTAQKRQEDIQDVPVSIQALGTERLEQLHVSDFDDYVQFLPSVTFQTFGPGFAQVYMRGVASGGDGNHSGSLPSVGMYLDEQPITTIQGNLDIHMYDIERVEALAGPQGTLYGASSQAGTVRIITNKPSTEGFEASYDLEANSVANGDQGYVVEGFANVPLGSAAAIRLVGWKRHDPGFIDNVFREYEIPSTGMVLSNAGHEKENYNDVDTIGARAALRIDLNDSWTVTPTLMAQEQETEGVFGYDRRLGPFKVAHRFPEDSRDRWMQAALTVEGRISNFDITYAGSLLKRKVDYRQDYADYAYWYDVDYASYDPPVSFASYFYDNDGALIDPSQFITAKDRYTKESHELRFASPGDKRFRFIGGLFMQRQVHDIEQNYQVANFADSFAVTGWPDTLWLTSQERIDRDYAVFGEASFDVTDAITVTGGLRFFRAENSLIGFFGFSDDFSGSGNHGETLCSDVIDPDDDSVNPDDPDNDNRGNSRGDTTGWVPFKGLSGSAPCTNLNRRVKEDDSIHKLSVQYRFDEDRMVYATWSRGFRPGGINRVGTIPPYTSDFLTNYEIGWKTTWGGNRFRFNGAIFKQDWEDFQYSFLGPNGLTIIRNAAQASINGIEADITWAVNTDLTLSAGAAYVDAELDENYCGTVYPDGRPVTNCDDPNAPPGTSLQAPAGTQLPITPKFKANMTARYGFDVGSMDAHVQVAAVYQDKAWADLPTFERELLGPQRAYTLVDLSSGITNGEYSFELFVTNVFDKLAEISRYAECPNARCGPQTYIVPFRPRTIGLKFGQRF